MINVNKYSVGLDMVHICDSREATLTRLRIVNDMYKLLESLESHAVGFRYDFLKWEATSF